MTDFLAGMQLVGLFCKGLLPGLLPLVWSIAVLKASHDRKSSYPYCSHAAAIVIRLPPLQYSSGFLQRLARTICAAETHSVPAFSLSRCLLAAHQLK